VPGNADNGGKERGWFMGIFAKLKEFFFGKPTEKKSDEGERYFVYFQGKNTPNDTLYDTTTGCRSGCYVFMNRDAAGENSCSARKEAYEEAKKSGKTEDWFAQRDAERLAEWEARQREQLEYERRQALHEERNTAGHAAKRAKRMALREQQ